MIRFNPYSFDNPTEAEKKLQEKMQRAVDKMMEEQNRLEDEATINALRRYGYDVIKWHPYPQEKPSQNGWYLVTNSYAEGRTVYFDLWDDHVKFLKKVVAWAELPKPYEG